MSTSSPSPHGSKYSTRELELAAHSPWWWSMADNPPCTDWCQDHHDPYEFKVAGSFSCRRPFGTLGVTVTYFRVADDETPFNVVAGAPPWFVDLITDPRLLEAISPSSAERLAQDLIEAARFVRRAQA